MSMVFEELRLFRGKYNKNNTMQYGVKFFKIIAYIFQSVFIYLFISCITCYRGKGSPKFAIYRLGVTNLKVNVLRFRFVTAYGSNAYVKKI